DDFLKKLKGEPECDGPKKDKNTYDKPEEFVNSMGGYKYCKDTSQTKIKKDEENDEAHVFKDKPHKYKTGCDWTDKTTPPPPAAPPTTPVAPKIPQGDDACEIVKKILENKNPTDNVDNCNQKINSKNPQPYPEWDCANKKNLIRSEDSGACMPPRRQKLCLYYLANTINGSSDQKQLREAVIKSAAAETFLHWNYYIKYGNGKDKKLDDQLKEGNIPLDFMRSMFYTYGDYRNLCVGKNIGSSDDTNKIGPIVTSILKNGTNGGKEPT
ncbi:putative EMP1-like protein, partial [Plasmodium gaboni]